MVKTKLIELFYQLSKLERNSLIKFAQSPYLQTRKDVCLLFEYLNTFPEKAHKQLDRQVVFTQVYPNKPFRERKIYDLTTLAFQALEDFLTFEQFQKNKHKKLLELVDAYQDRGLFDYSKKVLKKTNLHLEQQTIKNSTHYFQQYQFKYRDYLQQHHLQQQRNAPISLEEVSKILDGAYIAEKLKQACLLLAHQAMYKTSYQTGLLSAVLPYIQRNPKCLELPAVAIYYYCYQLLTQPSDTSFFQEFKQLLSTHIHLFPTQEIKDLYLLVINFCIKAYNNGQEQYLKETFELYQQALVNNVLLENGQLSAFAFTNIISIALKLEQVKWTTEFIASYQDYLDSEIKETYVHYSTAKLKFTQRKYSEAMLLLQEVDSTDLFLSISAKVMLLKIYYELEEYDVLDSFLHSFKTFLHRKKLIGYHKENYLNIIKFTQKLLVVNPFDREAMLTLQKQINQTASLSEREWLLEQLSKHY
ncbi:MAG: hypothetical protein GY810_08145 [Aureispira sp.]|nr:hypothetical protein [Aureispira sp.]